MTVCHFLSGLFLSPINITDITYKSLAKAFNQKLAHHEETIRRMNEMNKNPKWAGTQNAEQLAATHRMALFPENAEVIYVGKDWVVRKTSLSPALANPFSFSLWYDWKGNYVSFQES